jgi:hypothetical protein
MDFGKKIGLPHDNGGLEVAEATVATAGASKGDHGNVLM